MALFAVLIISGTKVFCADGSAFKAPIANPLEARIGTMVQFGTKDLRLDIGASIDVMEIMNDSASGTLRIGTDFMTYTRLRSEGNLKFPVETSDYYFGVNSTYNFPESPVHVRLRVAHISSHLVDGLTDSNSTFSAQKPFVFSREFADILFGYTFGIARAYAGATFLWATQPRSADRFIPQAGVDVRIPITITMQFRAGFDWKMSGVNGVYVTQQAAQAGVFFDTWNGRGLSLNVYGYNGRSMHGMFFNQSDSYVGLGFQLIW
ncbi:MAG: DUF1207 domain-containing protein [Ignavibacteria bacterium]|nr:DUF1207 domain-containing protein [Ignavibacteria bacterium]